jgi:hypothetical protein
MPADWQIRIDAMSFMTFVMLSPAVPLLEISLSGSLNFSARGLFPPGKGRISYTEKQHLCGIRELLFFLIMLGIMTLSGPLYANESARGDSIGQPAVEALPEDSEMYTIIKGTWSGTTLITEENGIKRIYRGSFTFYPAGRVAFKWNLIPARPFCAGGGSCDGKYQITGSNSIRFIKKGGNEDSQKELVIIQGGKRVLVPEEFRKIIDPVPPTVEITFVSDDVFLWLDPVAGKTVAFKKQARAESPSKGNLIPEYPAR